MRLGLRVKHAPRSVITGLTLRPIIHRSHFFYFPQSGVIGEIEVDLAFRAIFSICFSQPVINGFFMGRKPEHDNFRPLATEGMLCVFRNSTSTLLNEFQICRDSINPDVECLSLWSTYSMKEFNIMAVVRKSHAHREFLRELGILLFDDSGFGYPFMFGHDKSVGFSRNMGVFPMCFLVGGHSLWRAAR